MAPKTCRVIEPIYPKCFHEDLIRKVNNKPNTGDKDGKFYQGFLLRHDQVIHGRDAQDYDDK
jgi:hypothetical protein